MNPKKLISAIVAVAVLAVTLFFVFSNLGSLVAKAIRRAGGHVTGTDVSVGSVDIKVTEGRGRITRLQISNPSGFSGGDAFKLGEVSLDINVESLRSRDPIVIEEIRIAAPEILFEVDDKGQSNIDVIRKHAEAVTAGLSSQAGGDSKGDGTRILIRKIQFEKGRIGGDASAIGLEPFEVELPSFTLTNVGAPNGAEPAEIGKTITVALTKKATEAVARDKAGGILKGKLKGLGDKVKGLFK